MTGSWSLWAHGTWPVICLAGTGVIYSYTTAKCLAENAGEAVEE